MTTINIVNSSFLRLRTQAIQPFADDDTILNIDITGCTIDSGADIGTGIDLNGNDLATVNFNITGNPTIQSRAGRGGEHHVVPGRQRRGAGQQQPGHRGAAAARRSRPARRAGDEQHDRRDQREHDLERDGTEDTAVDVQSRFQTARVDATITNNTVTGEPTGVAGINLIWARLPRARRT